MADLPELVREHANRLHELASQARDVEEHQYSEGAVTSIQLDGLARLFVAQMEEYANIHDELLAALEALVEVMNDPRAEAIERRLKAKQQARAAIAKARGEQP